MNQKQLYFAKVLADTRSFVKTGDICHATQPTVSNAIARLEAELGGKLFIRTTRRVDVTPFGVYLLPWIESALTSRDELYSAAESYHNPAHHMLRIGLSPLVDTQYLDLQIKPFREAHANTKIFFKECYMDDLPERIRRNQLDIALVPACSVDDYGNKLAAYSEPLVFIPQAKNPNERPPSTISLLSVAEHQIILTGGQCGLNTTIKTLFHDHGLELDSYRGQAMSYRIIEEWAELGIGAGLLPQRKVSTHAPTIIPVTLEDSNLAQVRYFWVWQGSDENETLQMFLETLEE